MSETRTAREELDRALGMAARVLSFWRRALLVFVVTAAIGVPFSLTRPRTYKSETVILYQDNMTSHLTGEGGGGEASRRIGARLKEMLLSRASLEPIITEVHAYDALVEKRGMVDAVEEMRKKITFRAREGDTFEISYQGGSPEEVQDVTQRLADCIVKEAAGRRAEQAKALKAFVDAESDRNQIDLKTKEAALASFLASHPEFARIAALESQGQTTAPPGSRPSGTTGIVSSDPQLAYLEARASKIERDLAASAGTPRPATPPPAPRPESPELQAARRDLADKLAKYTDKHPDVAAARARLRAAEEAEAAAAKAAQAATPPPEEPPVQRTEAEREALRQQLAGLQAQIAARRQQLAAAKAAGSAAPAPTLPPMQEASVTLSVEYRRLAREVADARERQRQLDDKQFKASISASSATNDRNIQVSVLDPAYRPTHAISRPRSILLGIALAVCFVLALLTAVASALFDDRIHGRADLERLDLLPVVGVIPRATPPLLTAGKGDGKRPQSSPG